MPGHPWKSNFTAGELTQRLDARVDLDRYANGAACLKNLIVQTHGGAALRAGTTFIAAAKDAGAFQVDAFQEDAFESGEGSTNARLIPFQFSTEQAYMLEFGHEYIRFYADRAQLQSGGNPLEIVSPYAGEDLRALRVDQVADVMYILHPNYAPRKLVRVTQTTFELRVVNFQPPATAELEITPQANITLSALTGVAITVTANSPAFLAGDVSRQIKAGIGRAVITGFTSSVQVTAEVIDDFTALTWLQDEWTLDASPNQQLTPSAKEPRNAIITLTLAGAGWRSTDVGGYVRVNSGLVKITQVSSDTVATGSIVRVLTSVTAAPGGAWSLERPTWSAERGWPGAIAFWQGRLYLGGSLAQPDTVWGSVSEDFENFGLGPNDDDAVEFTVSANAVNLIRWMIGTQRLLIGTIGGEFTMDGGTDQVVTPDNVQWKTQTNYGCDYDVAPIHVGGLALFLQRGAQKLRELAFNFEADGYVAPDMSILAEHLLRDGVTELAYLSQPDQVVLAVRTDGVLLAMTYDRPEKVVAWSHHVTQGRFVSVATLPNLCGTGEEVWAIVSRDLPLDSAAFQVDAFQEGAFDDTVDESNVAEARYIEVFDGGLSTDSALTYAGIPVTGVTGLDHLEGMTVKVVGIDRMEQEGLTQDDLFQEAFAYSEEHEVSGGLIGLDTSRSEFQVGLGYTPKLETLRIEVPTPNGTAQARKKRWNEFSVRLYCTTGAVIINGESKSVGTVHFTGDHRKTPELGWNREGQMTIEKTDSLPITILGITGSLGVED